jgi:hypothetical protein
LLFVLRQIHSGFPARPTAFPQSIVLIGLRDVQNYKIAAGGSSHAIGRDRIDLCLRYREVILGIEVKVWRDGKPDLLRKGKEHLEGYLARLGQDFGWLVIFDRRSVVEPIEERLSCESMVLESGRVISVIRA